MLMEWKGCGIFGKLWKLLHSRRADSEMRVDAKRMLSESNRPQSSPRTVSSSQNDSIAVETYKDSFVSDVVKLGEEHVQELNHTIAILKPEQVRQRPHSAHIPFRPVVLFEEQSTAEEVQYSQGDSKDDTERSSQLRLRSIQHKQQQQQQQQQQKQQQPLMTEGTSVHAVACGCQTSMTSNTSEILNLQPANVINTATALNPIMDTTTTGIPQRLIMKMERLTFPKRSEEMLHVIDKTSTKKPLKLIRKKTGSINARNLSRGSRIRHVYPYFMPEAAYVKLKQEERWKELRRELRLELETQLDCDTIRRTNRSRRVYQIPVLSQLTESTLSPARLLTVPLNLSCLLRLGVVRKPWMKPQLQFPRLRMTRFGSFCGRAHGHRRRYHFRRGHRITTTTTDVHDLNNTYQPNVEANVLETNKTKKGKIQERLNAENMIHLYNTASELVYNYSDNQLDKVQSPIWTWKHEKLVNEDRIEHNEERTAYKDILDGLLVPLDRKSRRRGSKKRNKQQPNTKAVANGDQPTPSTSAYSNPISLSKVAVEGMDWREGLLAQGVRLQPQLGEKHEIFIRQLIALERLQLLTRLEESESIINPNDELYSITQHRNRLKHTRVTCKTPTGLNKRGQNLPPLNNGFGKQSKPVVHQASSLSKSPILTAYGLTPSRRKRDTTDIALQFSDGDTQTVSPVRQDMRQMTISLPTIGPVKLPKQWNNSTTTRLGQRSTGWVCRRRRNRPRHREDELPRQIIREELELHSPASTPLQQQQQNQQRLHRRRLRRRKGRGTQSFTVYQTDSVGRSNRSVR